MKLSLIVLTAGKQEGKKLEIKAFPFLIGRDAECHLRPVSPLISKKHCAFNLKDGKVFLEDFGSTNGSVLNGEAVKGEAELKTGDRVKVGPIEFEVLIEVPAEKKAVEPKSVVKKPSGDSVNKAPSAVKKPTEAAAPVKTPVAATAEKKAEKPVEKPVAARKEAETGGGDGDDDIAAMLLSLGDDESGATTSTVTAEAIPDGTTMMDIPVPAELKDQPQAQKDSHQKAKEAQQNSSQAARDILSKYMRRPR